MADGYEYPLIDGLGVDEIIDVVNFFSRQLNKRMSNLQVSNEPTLSMLIENFNRLCLPKWSKNSLKGNLNTARDMIPIKSLSFLRMHRREI